MDANCIALSNNNSQSNPPMQTNTNSKRLTTEELQQLHAKLAIEDRNETQGISCLINNNEYHDDINYGNRFADDWYFMDNDYDDNV